MEGRNVNHAIKCAGKNKKYAQMNVELDAAALEDKYGRPKRNQNVSKLRTVKQKVSQILQ